MVPGAAGERSVHLRQLLPEAELARQSRRRNLAEGEMPPVESGRRSSPERRFARFVLAINQSRSLKVTDIKKKHVPPATQQSNPESGLEEKLEEHPDDADAKVDVGSDESMDASDPSSAVQPAHDEPAPSSDSPEERGR